MQDRCQEKSPSTKFHLKIDYREKSSGIVQELEKQKKGFELEITNLKIGDYQLANQFIIERKTISDFMQSVKDGRIFRQAYQMTLSNFNPVLIVEGDTACLSKMKRAAIQGALIHLNVMLGIPVLRSYAIEETAKLIQFIAAQSRRKKQIRVKPLANSGYGYQLNKDQRIKLSIIQMIPGIGAKKAYELLSTFGSIKNIIIRRPEEFLNVKGIGNKLAYGIHDWINSSF